MMRRMIRGGCHRRRTRLFCSWITTRAMRRLTFWLRLRTTRSLIIEQTIKSVIGQTTRPAKRLSVSDCSADRTDVIVSEICSYP